MNTRDAMFRREALKVDVEIARAIHRPDAFVRLKERLIDNRWKARGHLK